MRGKVKGGRSCASMHVIACLEEPCEAVRRPASRSADFIRLVHWSDEEDLFIGRSPSLFMGGVHGDDEFKVYRDLVVVIEDWVETTGRERFELPTPTANKTCSGKFNLRVAEELHELLALEAMKVSESLNSYVVKSLRKTLD